MQNEMVPDDMRSNWQNLSPAPAPPPLEEVRKRAGKFRSQISRRNLREYVVSALLMPYFGYCAWTASSPVMQAGNELMIAGLLYMVYQLHRRAAAPAEIVGQNCVVFHRAELARQRDALRSVWKWYLGPMLPGLATIAASGSLAGFRRSVPVGMLTLIFPVVVALAFWGVGRLNHKAAVEIQKQIDALDAMAAAG